MTAQTFTDRTAPAPWGVCDGCGAAAPVTADVARCPACLTRDARYTAAEAHLQALALPVLTAWASAWARAEN